MSIADEIDISCQYQEETDSGLYCKIAELGRGSLTNQANENVCLKCDIGKIYREIKCPNIGGKPKILGIGLISGLHLQYGGGNLWCRKRKRNTAIEACKNCSLIIADTTKAIVEKASGLFDSAGFTDAKEKLNGAYKKINIEQDYDGAIREATVSLESTLTLILEKMGITPNDKTVTGLYSEVRTNLKLGDEISAPQLKQVLGSSAGAVSGLGAMRNDLSDAHGKGLITSELYESYAELALNLSATMSTFVIRRYKEAHTGN
jgi:hypothetical protein